MIAATQATSSLKSPSANVVNTGARDAATPADGPTRVADYRLDAFRGRSRSHVVIENVDGTDLTPSRSYVWSQANSVECYVSRLELAGLMGVSVATVDRMVAEGMPSVTWGRRTRRFRPSLAIAWAMARGVAQ